VAIRMGNDLAKYAKALSKDANEIERDSKEFAICQRGIICYKVAEPNRISEAQRQKSIEHCQSARNSFTKFKSTLEFNIKSMDPMKGHTQKLNSAINDVSVQLQHLIAMNQSQNY
jgi:hypothetical protein